MNRRILLIISVGTVAMAIVAVLLTMTRPEPETPAPAADAARPVPEPSPAPVARAPSPAPAPSPVREPEPPPAPVAAPAAPEARPAAPTSGALRIVTDVPAIAFVDRVYIGDTPATATGLSLGQHRLNVSAEGYEGIAETVEVAPGTRDVEIRFREVRLDAAIDVVHKHRMGSCSGRLVATPRSLTYETDNKNDGFSVPLTSLGSFEIDYLKKNLAVEVNGRNYNFTDPAGNADNLAVFHRDVEKARERLAAGDPPAGS